MRSRCRKLLSMILATALVISSAVPVMAGEVVSKQVSKKYAVVTFDDEFGYGHYDAKNDESLGYVHVGTMLEDAVVLSNNDTGLDSVEGLEIVSVEKNDEQKDTDFITPGLQTLTVMVSGDGITKAEKNVVHVCGDYYELEFQVKSVSGANYWGDYDDLDVNEGYVGDEIDIEDIDISANAIYPSGYNAKSVNVESQKGKSIVKDALESGSEYEEEYVKLTNDDGHTTIEISPTTIEKEGDNEITVKVKHDSFTDNYTGDDFEGETKLIIKGIKRDEPTYNNGYNEEQNEALTFGVEKTIIKEAKTKKGDSVSLDMALYTAEAVIWNGKAAKFNKNSSKRNNLPIDIDKSKVFVNGTEAEIASVKVKNAGKAYVSGNSIFAKSVSDSNLTEYKKTESKGPKKTPQYFIQLKAKAGADKATKQAIRNANRYFKENPVHYEIPPMQIQKAKLKVKLNGKGTRIKSVVSDAANGIKLKNKKEFKASLNNNVAEIEGVGNYNGKTTFKVK